MGVASALLTRGAKVILTSTRQAKLDDKISQLRSIYKELDPSHVTGYTLDLGSQTVEDNIRSLVSQLQKDGINKIEHLVYPAGDSLPLFKLEDIEIDSWMKASQIRTISFVLCIKHFLPLIKAAGPASADYSASITLTGALVADKPLKGGWTLLAMVAAAVNGAARQLALDLKPIRVNTVAPGVVDTELWAHMSDEERKGFYEEVEKNMPMGRVGDVRDVAEAYAYAMSDGNLTGEVLRTNSGGLLV